MRISDPMSTARSLMREVSPVRQLMFGRRVLTSPEVNAEPKAKTWRWGSPLQLPDVISRSPPVGSVLEYRAIVTHLQALEAGIYSLTVL